MFNSEAKMVFKSIKEIALFLTICPIVFQQLAHGLATEKSVPNQQSTNHHQAKLRDASQTNDTDIAASNKSPPIASVTPAQQEVAIVGPWTDPRRPIWNLAHMVNSIKELDYRLEKGANAVEADVTFGREGDPLYTYHGPPCDCWRHCHQQEEFNEYLSYVREIAIDDQSGIGKNLSLLFLDLKLDYLDQRSKARAGIELAKSIMSNLFLVNSTVATRDGNSNITRQNPKNQLKLILSVNHVGDIDLVHNFIYYLEQNNATHMMDRIGFDVGMNDDLQQIESMWKRFGNTLNLWQGDGYTNCFSPFYNLERLSKALLKRDNEFGYPRKVYQWTIDLHDRMREALRMGVDAVMTNHPERLVSVLREPNMVRSFRLATREDDPFRKIIHRASSESARYQRSANPTSGGFLGSLLDVVASWFAYIKEIPFLSLPTTVRFMPKSSSSLKRHKQASMAGKMGNSQPEYRVDANNNSISDSSTTFAPNMGSSAADGERISISDSVDLALVSGQNGGDQLTPYEGPKWYTSLVSNVLVSVLKLVLPTQ